MAVETVLQTLPFRKVEVKQSCETPSKGKILLVHINPYDRFPGSFSEPVGVQQLAGTVMHHGVPVDIHLGLVKNSNHWFQSIETAAKGDYTHVGLSMPLGTLEDGIAFVEHMDFVNAARKRPLELLIGGNLPTSIPTKYMTDLVATYPFVTVVRGWGDKPLTSILQQFTQTGGEPKETIPGLIFHDGNKVTVNPLIRDDPNFELGLPLHDLLEPDMIPSVTASRDCSHPYCTFCARFPLEADSNITPAKDIAGQVLLGTISKGKGARHQIRTKEVWRPSPIEFVVTQMEDLSSRGFFEGTYTDEEALGTSLEHAAQQGNNLAVAISQAKKEEKIHPDFAYSFSTRSDSIVALVDAGEQDILMRLRQSGLARVFLGVETGIPDSFERWDGLQITSQGKRYGKGIDVREHIRAVDALQDAGIGIEIGFIPFDPLMDLAEIRENARFLLANDLAKHTSSIFNWLRMQSGAKYEKVVINVTSRLKKADDTPEGLNLDLLGEFDPSTLQTEYKFFHPLVGSMVDLFRQMELSDRERLYKLKSYYRTKLITGEPTSGRAFETLTQRRELDLQLMTATVDWAEREMQKRGLKKFQYDELAPCFDTNDDVKVITKAYLTERENIWEEFLKGDMPDSLRTALATKELK